MLSLLLLLPAAAPPAPDVVPLANAHAHNDYAHKRPLFDALDNGFTSVEADVYLRDGKLLVGHTPFDLRKDRTLESLYLDPLKKRVDDNKGHVYPPRDRQATLPFFLLVDVKSDDKKTYAALDEVFAKYASILTVCRDGKVTQRAVTVVISGNCPRKVIEAQKVRYASIDGRPGDLDSDVPAHLMPFVSASWGSQFSWRGVGEMPQTERKKLREMVAKAHRHGRRVRFWATPERESLWRELLDAEVDLVNTDKLVELRRFLLRR
jgi:hypothetical protein